MITGRGCTVATETDNPFEKVLDRLREKGWCKGGFDGPDGSHCIVGAFRGFLSMARLQSLEGILREQYPDRIAGRLCPIPNFNDHPDTTFADVERVLEKAAIKWEEERVLRND